MYIIRFRVGGGGAMASGNTFTIRSALLPGDGVEGVRNVNIHSGKLALKRNTESKGNLRGVSRMR